jgi:hypothetical protein
MRMSKILSFLFATRGVKKHTPGSKACCHLKLKINQQHEKAASLPAAFFRINVCKKKSRAWSSYFPRVIFTLSMVFAD